MAAITPNPGMGNNKKIMIPKPNPGASKKAPIVKQPIAKKAPIVKPLPVKKALNKQNPIKMAPPSPDDKIYRTMPITEKDLGTIKKMYGIK
jgi:hypothetical protein